MNSTEHSFKMKSSSFGSLEDVIELGQLDRTKPGIVLNDGNSGTVKDYQHESGVIYQGQALGCPAP
ncbi:MAG TPA: hypothetical protein VHQ95_05000 [Pyrinomonadaceae bacterium]|nr:hypothetical protein [Pyrinomonadaceae bacterium]